jgi:hypothetical protein
MKTTTEDIKELLDALSLFIMETALSICFVGVVFVILYGLLFVIQPMAGQSLNDKAMFAILTPLAIFLPTIMREMIAMKRNKPIPPPLPPSLTQAYNPPEKLCPAPPTMPPPAPMTPPARGEPVIESMAPVVTGFNGKPAPPPAHQPEI